ncbi:hypothetical protein JCM33374_g121 [Metschnikowia sp. JCM 33374]|nr:hypothetical protein JCM33374_g121 [Metschnikowia sp. JCM 33374]
MIYTRALWPDIRRCHSICLSLSKWKIAESNAFLCRRILSTSTHISTKPTLTQLKEFTNSSLDLLRKKLDTQRFGFPYQTLNSLNKAKAAELMDTFEQKLWTAYDDFFNESKQVSDGDQRVSITQYFKPRPEYAPAIAQSIYMGLYPKDLRDQLGQESEEVALSDILTELYHQHILQCEILHAAIPNQVDMNWDISRPSDWYPGARKMKRKIIMHVGPTNSGKTYNSLQAFAKAKSGYYAGPLRLLAREIYEKFQSQNISCNLITGEEVIPSLDAFGNVAELSSGTIEMIPLHKKMDICIVDEIQMIADPTRGSAWTNAVLGVQAKELHLCGEESAVKLIEKLLETTGEELEVKRYKRMGKLTMLPDSVDKLTSLQKGDCLVAFSKRKILELKCQIENSTSLKVGVIYGALPPEIRSQESSKFNSGEYDVLVASDAIGMGLNLKIKRIVFWTSQKFDGKETVDLSVSNVKQIGGRAGRFTLKEGESEGFVTTFHRKDLAFIAKSMRMPNADLDKACIWPTNEFWSGYLSSFREPTSLKQGVDHFYKLIKEEDLKDFFLSDFEHQTTVIDLICSSGLDSRLTIEDQLKLAQVPANLKNAEPEVIEQTLRFFDCIAMSTSKSVLDLNFLYITMLGAEPSVQNTTTQILSILEQLEKNHKVVLVFMWLAQRWPTIFVDKESAGEIKTLIEKRIDEELACLRIVAKKEGKFAPKKKNRRMR